VTTVLYTILNTLYYHWRRNNWILDPRRFFREYDEVEIDRPIFFVGNQGAGITLIARMIRRHPDVVSISGDHTHWAGADEMQRVMEWRLSPNLKLARFGFWGEPNHPRMSRPRSWSYATDDLLPGYRKTASDYNDTDAHKLRFLIREALHRYGEGQSEKRFVDKSQVFTVKMRFVQALLSETEPYFVLITRNPYAACYRAAQGKAIDMERYARHMTLDERIKLCAQHWSNAMQCALEDGAQLDHFKRMRFEDFLNIPQESLKSLCSFLDVSFSSNLLPQEQHRVPLGSRFRNKWHPLRPEVNQSYLQDISAKHVGLIARRCESLARQLGYEKP